MKSVILRESGESSSVIIILKKWIARHFGTHCGAALPKAWLVSLSNHTASLSDRAGAMAIIIKIEQ